MKTLKNIDLNANDVYAEYTDGSSEYISYAKAKKQLNDITDKVRYSEPSTQKGCDFINSISRKRFNVMPKWIEPRGSVVL